MTKTNSTTRALLTSALALLMCVSMLIGSTFAWFTDSVTSSGNIIKSGTLDVEMYWAKGTEDPNADATAWTDASTGAILNNDLWEPGYTEVRHIKISNVGTLALKYQLHIFANGDVSKLADAIDVYFVDPAVQVADRTALDGVEPVGTLTQVLAGMPGNVSGDLNAGDSNVVTLALKMRESAGNEYQGLEIGSDFVIQLLATQNTVESDSFDNQYDANAEFLPVNESAAIVNNGGVLGEEVVLTAKMPYGTMKVTVPAGAQLSSDAVSALKLTVKNADPYVRGGTLDANKVANGYVIYVDGISDYKNPYVNPNTNRENYNYGVIMVEFPVGADRKDLTSYVNGGNMTMSSPYRNTYSYDSATGVVSFGTYGFAYSTTDEPSNFTFVYTKLSEAEKLLNSAIEAVVSGGSVSITSTTDNMVSLNNIADALDGTSNIVLVGSGTDSTVVASNGAVIEADGLTVADMSIQSANLQVVGSGTTVDNIDFTDIGGGYGLTVSGSDSTITNSTLRGNGNNILMFANNSDTAASVTTVSGCTFENMEGWGNKRGLRFQNMNGKIEISDSTFNTLGTALDLGPINSTVRGNVEISDSVVNTTSVNVSTVKSSVFDTVTFNNTWSEDAIRFALGGQTNTFTNCEFKADVNFVSANYGNKAVVLNLNNCTYNGVAITAENVLDHFAFNEATWGLNIRDRLTLVVDGTTVTVAKP